ncbi:MAG TPA: PRC-barrel domain-containing protein [Bryobacteraceae bacterium]|nr:PRC-barrel domain-containing protein [Bryobacteraceae bacterium]
MLRSAHYMTGHRIKAVDGDIGKVADWYFDDGSWAVRYLVADTGYWLPGRLVLLAPSVVASADQDEKVIEVGLTRQQIKESPPADSDQPVSRRFEKELQQHYGWPAYWTAPAGFIAPTEMDVMGPGIIPAETDEQDIGGDPHLRSAKELSGYNINATDGGIGSVQDLILDDEDWLVRYVLVNTKPWWPGGHVLVDVGRVQKVSWTDRTVSVDLTREQVRHSPPYDASRPMNREFQQKLYDYYRGLGPGAGR